MSDKPYQRILVPTDGSRAAGGALAEALRVARLTGGQLHALYVVNTNVVTQTSFDDMTFDGHVDEFIDRLEQEGEAATEAIREAAADEDVDVVTAVREGTPSSEILSYADDELVDLVVMATHGRRGISRYLLGSVTERVVRRATAPVMTVRHE